MRRCARGFTLVELVTIMIIVGVLAVVAIPRMDTSGFRATEFRDQVVAALRFAQKTAASHRRNVCVAFPDNHSLALTIAAQWGGACDTALPIPGTNGNRLVSGDSASVYFVDPQPAALTFAHDGTGADRTININGAASAIAVVGATGYVH